MPDEYRLDEDGLRVTWESVDERDYEIPAGMRLLVSDGQEVSPGQQLTEGSKNPHRILEILGRDAVTQYLLHEVQKVYRPQGQNIHDKHFEVIIRKMLSKVMINSSGDTELLPGDLVEYAKFQEMNEQVVEEGGASRQKQNRSCSVLLKHRSTPTVSFLPVLSNIRLRYWLRPLLLVKKISCLV